MPPAVEVGRLEAVAVRARVFAGAVSEPLSVVSPLLMTPVLDNTGYAKMALTRSFDPSVLGTNPSALTIDFVNGVEWQLARANLPACLSCLAMVAIAST